MNQDAMQTASVETGRYGRLFVARLKPDEDLVEAIGRLCAEHGIARAVVRGVVGSLCEATLARGHGDDAPLTHVEGPGVEVLNVSGDVFREDGANGASARYRTSISGVVADRAGRMYAGRFSPGGNRSYITLEVSLQEWLVESHASVSVTMAN